LKKKINKMLSFIDINLNDLTISQKNYLKDVKTLTDLKLKMMEVDYDQYIISSMNFKRYSLKEFLESFGIV